MTDERASAVRSSVEAECGALVISEGEGGPAGTSGQLPFQPSPGLTVVTADLLHPQFDSMGVGKAAALLVGSCQG